MSFLTSPFLWEKKFFIRFDLLLWKVLPFFFRSNKGLMNEVDRIICRHVHLLHFCDYSEFKTGQDSSASTAVHLSSGLKSWGPHLFFSSVVLLKGHDNVQSCECCQEKEPWNTILSPVESKEWFWRPISFCFTTGLLPVTFYDCTWVPLASEYNRKRNKLMS